MGKSPSPTLCVRMPLEMHAAIIARAEADGLSPSEVVRAIVHRWVYDDVPTIDEGYAQGRALALRLAHDALQRAFEGLPRNVEDVNAHLAGASERIHRNHGRNK